jgi:two-component system chemotaxis response regulator CheY
MKKCLIVDDEVTTRFILKAILEEYLACDMAENGVEALCAFDLAHQQGSHYELICLDITMPIMDGLKVLQHIREAERALSVGPRFEAKVIIITADSTSSTILNSFFSCGASAYITKPIDRLKLLHQLKTLDLIQSGI